MHDLLWAKHPEILQDTDEEGEGEGEDSTGLCVPFPVHSISPVNGSHARPHSACASLLFADLHLLPPPPLGTASVAAAPKKKV